MSQDYIALEWVKGEIQDTLQQAQQSLEAYGENPQDKSRLKFCFSYLHQIHGTLQMVEFYGAALLAEEMEAVASALAEGQLKNERDGLSVLMQAIIQLPYYLDHVKVGKRDLPVVLLPILNELRSARGQSLLSETALFSPRMVRKAVLAPAQLKRFDQSDFQQWIRKVRQMYQAASTQLLQNKKPEVAKEYLLKVFSRLDSAIGHTPNGVIWLPAMAFAEWLMHQDHIPASSKLLLRELDGMLKELIEDSQSALNQAAPDELVKNLLFYVARTSARGDAISRVQSAYQLHDALPSDDEIQREREALSGPDRDTIGQVLSALSEEISSIKDKLDLMMRDPLGGAAAMEDIEPALKQVSDTMAMLGLGQTRQAVQEQLQVLHSLREKDDYDRAALFEVAGALLFVEASLNGMMREGSLHGSADMTALSDAQKAVLREARNVIEQVKDAVIAYVGNQWNRDELEGVPGLLYTISGSLRMVPLMDVAEVLAASAPFIEDLIETGQRPDWSSLDAFAEILSGVEYYIERYSSHNDGSSDHIMDKVWESLEQLTGQSRSSLQQLVEVSEPDADGALEEPEQQSEVESETPIEEEPEQAAGDEPSAIAVEGDEIPLTSESAEPVERQHELGDDHPATGSAESVEGQSSIVSPDPQLEDVDTESSHADADSQNTEAPIPTLEPEQTNAEVATGLNADATSSNADMVPGPVSFDLPPAPIQVADIKAAIDSDLIDEDIIEVFLEEAAEVTSTLDSAWPQYQNNPQDSEALTTVRRAFHTLKGSGRMVQALIIGELAWSVENLFNRVIDKTIEVTPELIQLVDHVISVLPVMIDDFRHQRDSSVATQPLMDYAFALASGLDVPPFYQTSDATSDDEDDDQSLLDVFVQEANGHIAVVNGFIAESRAEGFENPVCDQAQRALHTLKGSAHMAGLSGIATLASPMEKLLKELRAYSLNSSTDLVALLEDGCGIINSALTNQELIDVAVLPGAEEFLARVQRFEDSLRERLENADVSAQAVVNPQAISNFLASGMDSLLDADQLLPEWQQTGDIRVLESLIKDLVEVAEGARAADQQPIVELASELNAFYNAISTADPDQAASLKPHWVALAVEGQEQLLNMMDCLAAGQALEPADILPSLREATAGIRPANQDVPVLVEEDLAVENNLVEPSDADEVFEDSEIPLLVEDESVVPGNDSTEAPDSGYESYHSVSDVVADDRSTPDGFDALVEVTETENSTDIEPGESIELLDDEIKQDNPIEPGVPVELSESFDESAYASGSDHESLDLDTPLGFEPTNIEPELEEDTPVFELQERTVVPDDDFTSDEGLSDGLFDVPAGEDNPAVLETEAAFASLTAEDSANEEASASPELPLTEPDSEQPQPERDTDSVVVTDDQWLTEDNESFSLDSLQTTEPGFDEREEWQATSESDSQAQPDPASLEYAAPPVVELDDGNDEIVGIFLEESTELLESIDQALVDWQEDPENLVSVARLQRDLHTIKGGARMAELGRIADLCHELETVYERAGNGRLTLTDGLFELLQSGHDKLNVQVEQIAQGRESEEASELVAQLQKYLFSNSDQALADVSQPDGAEAADHPTVDADSLPSAEIVSEALDESDREILEIFIEESAELHEALDQALHGWQDNPLDMTAAEEAQRTLHTLKGGARLAGLLTIGNLAHEFETRIVRVQQGYENADDAFFQDAYSTQDALIRAIDAIAEQLESGDPIILDDGEVSTSSGDHIQPDVDMSEASDAAEAFEASNEPEAEQAEQAEEPVAASSNIVPLRSPISEDEADDSDTSVATPKLAGAPLVDVATAAQQVAAKRAPQELVKVSADLLDDLVNLAGETSIGRGRLEQQVTDFSQTLVEMEGTLDRLRDQLRRLDMETEAQVLFRQERQGPDYEDFDPLEMDRYSTMQQLSRALVESASDLLDLKETLADKTRDAETLLLQQSRVNTELQEGLMKTRMVQFQRLVPRLRRIVRQVSQELGKQVDFRVLNADGELDRTILERMVSPLEHMVRNAVDHGIESAEERRRSGKSDVGNIELEVGREGGDVVINLRDDGKGINRDAVRAKAIERGLLAADANVSDHDLLQFILQAGFSTAQSVTQISGRGVGLDVVSTEIKQMGGTVQIHSEPGQGTRFEVRLPFTVSVNRALMVKIGDDLYAVPLNNIRGIVRVSGKDLQEFYQRPANERIYEYAGEQYPLEYLGTMLENESAPKIVAQNLPLPVLLVNGAVPYALQVDTLLGSREIVVKTLGPQFASVSGVSGGTILGDGSVVIILDLPAMIRTQSSLEYQQAKLLDNQLAEQRHEREQRPPRILVVDDSVTVRKVTTRLLERNGMEVITAQDGVDAVATLQDHMPDLMLLDIEMPRMDGFELASIIRHDSRLKHIPIIMITSRTGDKHRERALGIGVNEYMGKPFQEELLFTTMNRLLGREDS